MHISNTRNFYAFNVTKRYVGTQAHAGLFNTFIYHVRMYN